MNSSLALVSPAHPASVTQRQPIAQRLVLYQGELYRVPAAYHLLRVHSGQAYVTQAGQDRILLDEQELQLDSAADMALVSGIGGQPVILELFSPQN